MLNYLFKALPMSFCIDIELTIWYNEVRIFQSILIKLGRGIAYGIYKNK